MKKLRIFQFSALGCLWVPRGHGVYRGHGAPWARGPDPRAHGVKGNLPGYPVHTGSRPPWARGAQEVSVGAPTASFGGWLFKGSSSPPVCVLFIHILTTLLSPIPPSPKPYLPSM
jgi:hypothetical protein